MVVYPDEVSLILKPLLFEDVALIRDRLSGTVAPVWDRLSGTCCTGVGPSIWYFCTGVGPSIWGVPTRLIEQSGAQAKGPSYTANE
jgi:hypothetical protein